MNYTINFGKTKLKYSLKRKKRKTLAIHVYPDQSIEVVAPEESSMDKVKEKVLKRAPWIIRKQIEEDEAFRPFQIYVCSYRISSL